MQLGPAHGHFSFPSPSMTAQFTFPAQPSLTHGPAQSAPLPSTRSRSSPARAAQLTRSAPNTPLAAAQLALAPPRFGPHAHQLRPALRATTHLGSTRQLLQTPARTRHHPLLARSHRSTPPLTFPSSSLRQPAPSSFPRCSVDHPTSAGPPSSFARAISF